MEYNWPETKFVKQNTILEQIGHLLSEADEITALGPVEFTGDPQEDLQRLRPLFLEVFDLLHSGETLMRMIVAQYGETSAQDLADEIFVKNAARGYYPGIDPAPFQRILEGDNQ